MRLKELGFVGNFSGGLIVLGEALFIISLPAIVEMWRLLSSPWARMIRGVPIFSASDGDDDDGR
jgi:hypothetical protein